MIYQSYSHKEQALWDAVHTAENAAILLRQYASAVLLPGQEISEYCNDTNSPIIIQVTREGELRVSLPGIMPRRGDNDRSRFLAGLLREAICRTFPEREQPRFHTCVLVYEHIYALSQTRRFIDHDNLELKHCQDVLESAFLTNDSSALCSAFQCSHRGPQDGTSIWIMRPEQFPQWLKNHMECWYCATENV